MCKFRAFKVKPVNKLEKPGTEKAMYCSFNTYFWAHSTSGVHWYHHMPLNVVPYYISLLYKKKKKGCTRNAKFIKINNC